MRSVLTTDAWPVDYGHVARSPILSTPKKVMNVARKLTQLMPTVPYSATVGEKLRRWRRTDHARGGAATALCEDPRSGNTEFDACGQY